MPFCMRNTRDIHKQYNIELVEGLSNCLPCVKKVPRAFVDVLCIVLSATPFRCVLNFVENKTLHYNLSKGHLRTFSRVSSRPVDISHLLSLNDLIETSLEASPQLLLQTCLLTVDYMTDGPNAQLEYSQLLSILTALLAIAWAVRSQHCMAKHGNLSFLNSMVIFTSVLFQVIARVIACTLFTATHTWYIILLATCSHFSCILLLKHFFEEPVYNKDIHRNRFQCTFYGMLASTLVYCRPFISPFSISLDKHRTFIVQTFYLFLAALENTLLLSLGLSRLDRISSGVPEEKAKLIKIVCVTACAASFVLGVSLQVLHYTHFHHKRQEQYRTWRSKGESHLSIIKQFAIISIHDAYSKLKQRVKKVENVDLVWGIHLLTSSVTPSSQTFYALNHTVSGSIEYWICSTWTYYFLYVKFVSSELLSSWRSAHA